MKDIIPSVLIKILAVTFYVSSWFLFLSKPQKNQLCVSFLETFFSKGMMDNFFVLCRYSTMNIAMFSHFVSIIFIFGTSLLCSSILMIMSTLVVSMRLWFIILWIISRLWLIIRWNMLSTILSIMIFFPFIKTMCLMNYYISANLWNTLYWFLQ